MTKYYSTKRVWELGFLNVNSDRANKLEILFIFLKRILNSKFNKFFNKFIFLGIINETQYEYIPEYIKMRKSFLIDGYWQSEEYFSKNKKSIKTFLNLKIKGLIKRNKSNCETVAVHIRLGDYVNTSYGINNHLICNIEWYKYAISYLKGINRNLKFTIFSDDKDFVKNEFSNFENLEIYNSDYSKNAYQDLLEMTNYDHFIISNSSYSWWASYLGEKNNTKIIAPKYWYKNVKTNKISIFRKNWILL